MRNTPGTGEKFSKSISQNFRQLKPKIENKKWIYKNWGKNLIWIDDGRGLKGDYGDGN